MKIFIMVFITLFLFLGCAQKIVPGKAPKTTVNVVKEPIDKVVETVPEATMKPEAQAVITVAEDVLDHHTTEAIEEDVEESPTSRFAKSDLISSKSYKVTMKTKKFAFSDTGFLNIYDNLINLQVFTMGKLALDLKISLAEDDICVDQLCNTKEGFNQTFLSGNYPDALVEKVLQSKPILGGKNLQRTSNGFMQKIVTNSYDIKYKIWPGNIYFKDAKNGIMIKLLKLAK